MNSLPDGNHEIWPPAPTVTVDTGGQRLPPSWLASAPLEVLFFAVFCAVAGLVNYWLVFLGPKIWWKAIIPYVGSSLGGYLNPLIFACLLLFGPKAAPPQALKRRRHMTAAMAGLLLLLSVFGGHTFMLLKGLNVNQFHNPYMAVSDWQPLWTVALPLAWALVLLVCAALRARRTQPLSA